MRADAERAERNGFERMGRKLDREAEELAAERYFPAMHGVRTSWHAIERAAIYNVWRRRDGVRIRQSTSLRPVTSFNRPMPQIVTIDRHHVAWHFPLSRAA